MQGCRSVQGQVNEEFLTWLSRSIVCKSEEPRDLGSLSSAIINGYGQCTKICALSGFKFILSFQTKEEMEVALQKHEELDLWFTEITAWDKYVCCGSRKVWLEVIGVPPHGWKWETFKEIADLWGYLICLGKSIARTDTFDSMRMLVETDILFFIENDFVLTIEELGYRVVVREIGSVSQVLQQAKQIETHHAEDTDSTKGVLGFEDIEENVNPQDGNGSEDQRFPVCLDEDMDGNNQPADQVNSNSNFKKRNEGPVCAMPAISINSATRTKTANLSNEESSVEVIKKYTYLDALRLDGKGLLEGDDEESIQEPPGFEKSANNRHAVMNGPVILSFGGRNSPRVLLQVKLDLGVVNGARN